MADKGLRVCSKCGWYAHDRACGAPEACRADLGAAATALAYAIDIPSTKLGYGARRLTFNLHDGFNITLDVVPAGFGFDRFWLLGYYAPEDVKELIEAIRKTKIGQGLAAEMIEEDSP